MRKNDYDQLTNLLADHSERDENGQQRAMGVSELARHLSKRSGKEVSKSTIRDQMRIVFLSSEFLQKIEDREIPISYGYRVSRLYENPQIMDIVEKEVLEGKFKTEREINDRVSEYQKELERQAQELAEELREDQTQVLEEEIIEESTVEEPEQELPPPEIPDNLVTEQAKQIVSKPPKHEKTEKEKAQASLLKEFGKGSSVESKIDKAKELGIDVSKHLENYDNALSKIDTNPKTVWEEGKQLKKTLDSEIKKAKQTTEQKRIIEEAEERVRREEREKLKEELKEDEEFKKQVAKDMQSTVPRTMKNIEEDTEQIIEEEQLIITVGLDKDTYPLFIKFTDDRKMMQEEALKYLIKKGLEAEGYGR